MALPPGFGAPPLPPSASGATSAQFNRLVIEALQRRVTLLENRLARLENVVRISDRDVEIVSEGTMKITAEISIGIETFGALDLEAATLHSVAGMIDSASALTKFSGMLQCDTLIATSVISATYSPGAGNVW